MQYRKVVFSGIPHILFAHSYRAEQYNLHFNKSQNPKIELCYMEEGDVIQIKNGIETQISVPALFTIFHDTDFTMKSNAPLHRHSTVCFSAPYVSSLILSEEAAFFERGNYHPAGRDDFVVIFPEDGILHQQKPNIEGLVKRLIRLHSMPGSSSRSLQSLSLLFSLLSGITEQSVHSAFVDSQQTISPANLRYIRGAEKYIAEHLDCQIQLTDIAEHLGISTGHLSRLFKKVTGQAVLEYIVRQKMSIIQELILNKNVSLREAGESVGIYDENYLSRLFKKQMGITYREFKALRS